MNKGLAAAIGLSLVFVGSANAQQRYGDRYETPQYGDERLSDRERIYCQVTERGNAYEYLRTGALPLRSNGEEIILPIMAPLEPDWYGDVNISQRRVEEGLKYIKPIRNSDFIHPYTNNYVYESYKTPGLLKAIEEDIQGYLKVANRCPNTNYRRIPPYQQYDNNNDRRHRNNEGDYRGRPYQPTQPD